MCEHLFFLLHYRDQIDSFPKLVQNLKNTVGMQESVNSYCKCEATHSLLKSSEPQKWYSENLRIAKENLSVITKNRILKNVILLSISHFLVYQTALTLGNLQSTLNGDEGLGVASLAVQYGMAMLCILLFSEILIKSFGCKKMLVLMIALQLPYHASNFYPTWGTMIPTAAVAGATLGLVMMGVSVYIDEMSMLYHSIQDTQSLEVITSRFFGIFTFFALNSSIWGNLIAFFVLQPEESSLNHTDNNASCGIDFDPQSYNDNLQPPSDGQRFTIVGICLSGTVLSIILLVAFVDELERRAGQAMDGRCRCGSALMTLSAAVRHALVPDQLLLVPLTVFFGMQTAFLCADFTKAYIACSWGVYHIGFVTMCYGACGAIMGCSVGYLVKCTSQLFAMILAACLNTLLIIFLCIWQPSSDFVEVFFIVAAIWGTCDAIWWSQLSAIHGLLFPKNLGAAFSVMYFFVFLGYTFNFSTSNYLSIRVKIVIMSSFLITGVAGYLIGQIKIRLAEKRKNASAT